MCYFCDVTAAAAVVVVVVVEMVCFWHRFQITLRHTTVCRTPLDGRSARRRDLYLTAHNMPPVGFEPTILECERPQTYALDRAATGTSSSCSSSSSNNIKKLQVQSSVHIGCLVCT